MKKKSSFSQIIAIVIIGLAGLILTIIAAFWAGSSDGILFDLTTINWANFIPVLLIGTFITCVVVGIVVLIASKNIFLKIRDYFLEDKKDGGKKE